VERIAEAYRYFFFHYRETPLLVADVSEVDFVANSADFLDLVREIRSMAGGVQHYVPLGSK
jgi:deoxyadenosine/deoxycytidine kinase